MTAGNKIPPPLRALELEAVYAISRSVVGASDTEGALDEIVQLLRPVFIFDNVVLYNENNGATLEPTYARAIGRGRFREADLAWGEVTAQEAYNARSAIVRVEELDSENTIDRTNIRHSLGLPLKLGEQVMGTLVFIRFGGPVYTEDQIHLVEQVAIHVAQLLQHRQLVQEIANLEAKRRLDSLQDDFIATITHELLTPLGFVKGYATTLLREDTTWDKATEREFLTIIDEEADRLRELIDNLMDSSRLQAGTLTMTFQPLRVDTMMKDISLRAKSLHENMHIQMEVKTPGLHVRADPTRLAQVFDNIINNATKYAPGSRIKIVVGREKDRARISIRDYGPGISSEHLDKIFQRFYRVPEHSTTVRGTGLGLYICRKIIQAHGGEIEAESTLGEGTTFHIYLPYEKEA